MGTNSKNGLYRGQLLIVRFIHFQNITLCQKRLMKKTQTEWKYNMLNTLGFAAVY